MSLNSLRNEARNNLVVTQSIIDRQGGDIDVGEQFTVRFTVRNNFTGSGGESPGHAHFNNVTLRVNGTPHASVEGGNRTIDVVNHLGYGNSRTVDVTFNALIAFPVDWVLEPYAIVRVQADFDIMRFFRIVQDETFYTQIETG